jgi:hypothetical protein
VIEGGKVCTSIGGREVRIAGGGDDGKNKVHPAFPGKRMTLMALPIVSVSSYRDGSPKESPEEPKNKLRRVVSERIKATRVGGPCSIE